MSLEVAGADGFHSRSLRMQSCTEVLSTLEESHSGTVKDLAADFTGHEQSLLGW
jgi:hypothetical protein